MLTDVNMKEHVLSLPNQLAELVAEGGDNFSAGQRQVRVYFAFFLMQCFVFVF